MLGKINTARITLGKERRKEGRMDEESVEEKLKLRRVMEKIEHKFKGNTPISATKIAVAKHLLSVPDHEAPVSQLQIIADEILRQNLDPFEQKIKMKIQDFISYDYGFFSVDRSKSGYTIQLLVDNIFQQQSSFDWTEEETQVIPRETKKSQLQNSSLSQTNQICNYSQNSGNFSEIQGAGNLQNFQDAQQSSQNQSLSQQFQKLTTDNSQQQYSLLYLQQQQQQQNILINQSQDQQQQQQQNFQTSQAQNSSQQNFQLSQAQNVSQQNFQTSQAQNSSQQNQQQSLQQNSHILQTRVRKNQQSQLRNHQSATNQKSQFNQTLTELKTISDLQNLGELFDAKKPKAVGFDVKIFQDQISVISLSILEAGGKVQAWFMDFKHFSNDEQNQTILILHSIWRDRVFIVQDIASFGYAVFKKFKPLLPTQIIDVEIQFQQFQNKQNILGGFNLFEQFPKNDELWFTKQGKPALYGMLFCMDLIPVNQTLQNQWREIRKNVEWINRPLNDQQLQIIKQDVCYLGPLCDKLKKNDQKIYSEAFSNLSRAYIFWDIPLEERGGCDSQTFDRIEALKLGVEYEMKFSKITSERYPKFVPTFISYSSEKYFNDLQILESFREVSSVEGQEYLDVELESVLKVLPENVACTILKYLVPNELLTNQLLSPENRQIHINQSLQQQKNLVEIIYDDGDNGITLRTGEDDQFFLPCNLRMSSFIKKLKQSDKLIKQEFKVQQLLTKNENNNNNNSINQMINQSEEEDICKLKRDNEGGHPPFRADNRLGIPGTLHRVSVIFGPTGSDVSGIIFRIGRHLPGTALPFMDLLSQIAEFQLRNKNSTQGNQLEMDNSAPTPSILVMGQPGVGKTTLLRDIAYQLSEVFGLGKAVVVVDSSLEMGGEGRIPHTCLGKARRVAVANRSKQYVELQNVVQNQNPRVIIVDEIRDQNEVKTIRDISQRGVVMIATIHCPNLEALLANQVLKELVGGVKPVTLGDKEARYSNDGVKTRLERGGAPVFQSLVEVESSRHWKVHPNVAVSVDNTLSHTPFQTQSRRFIQEQQKIMIQLQGENKDESTTTNTNWLKDLVALNRSLNLN